MAKEQISVKLDREQLTFLEREAARQDRSLSQMLRHLVCEAARTAAVAIGQRAV